MLTASQFDALIVPITELYTEYESSVIADIARRLKNLSFDSAAWQTQRIIESGALYKDVLKKLSKLTGRSEEEIAKILKRAGVKAISFDDKIYKDAGLNPQPLNLSPAMLQTLKAGLEKTSGIANNLTMTTAISAQRSFIRAADLAYMQVSTGAMSYDQAIRAAIKNVAAEGLDVVDYASGHQDKLDVAMRRTVLTGVAQTANKLQDVRADEMGNDLVAVSAHAGARNTGVGPMNHESWQGKIYSRSGKNKKYPPFVETTGYGTGEGLGGWNCRHSFYPFFEGLSENAYSREELNSLNNQTVKFAGKELDLYTATQYQRSIERKIRYWKQQVVALDAAKLDATLERAKVAQWQKTMRDFISQTGLDRQYVREQVVTARIATTKPAVVELPVIEIPKVRPNGVPVSNALDVSGIKNKDVKSQVDLALKNINSVHGDGELPTIPIEQTGRGRNYGTFYFKNTMGSLSEAEKITIQTKGDHQALTTIHEIGHFIDHSGIPGQKWSSAYLITGTAKQSSWYKDLWKRFNEFNAKNSSGDIGGLQISRKWVNYLLDSKEIFARAYSQFIAIESGDAVLLAQLKKLQNQAFPTQWSDEDFEPIANEMRKLFRERGWML